MKQFYRSRFLLTLAVPFLLFSCAEEEAIEPNSHVLISKESTKNAYTAPENSLFDQIAPYYSIAQNTTQGVFTSGKTISLDAFTVPKASIWTVQEINVLSLSVGGTSTPPNTIVDVYIYRDKDGKPGELVHSSLSAPYLNLGEYFASTININIEDVRLGHGTYWFNLRSNQDALNIIRIPDPAGNYVFNNLGFDVFIKQPFKLAFTLLGDSAPDKVVPVIGDAQKALADALSAGTAMGVGPGNSAKNRAKAFSNMLAEAKALIDQGKTAEACAQLADAQKKIHMGGKVSASHFISGSAAASLSSLITEISKGLGCM